MDETRPDDHDHDGFLEIHGGAPLRGAVQTSGFKHCLVTAAAAAATAAAPVRIANCPDIVETAVLADLFRLAGGSAEYVEGTLALDAAGWHATELPADLVGRIHGSLYLLPGLLARSGVARMPASGGCAIGTGPRGRPVSHVLDVMERFGARTWPAADGSVEIRCDAVTGCTVDLLDYTRNKALMSGPCYGGATKTALLMASMADGTTTLHHPYPKPDVTDLVSVLVGLGADIEPVGPETLVIHGRGRAALCRPTETTLIPDLIEVVTWICAGVLLADEPLPVRGPGIDRTVAALAPEFDLFARMGVRVDVGPDELVVHPATGPLRPVEFTAASRGVFSDSQPFLALMGAWAQGPTLVTEAVWEHRYGFVPGFEALGMSTAVDGPVLRVDGGSRPDRPGHDLTATDLRAAAVLLLAALAVPGRTTLSHHHHLDRGYPDIVADLRRLGADVRRRRGRPGGAGELVAAAGEGRR